MKLSEWAKQQGLSYKTAWRMWKLGQLPIPVEQLPTGTVIVHPPLTDSEGGAALYARVSSNDQKSDLDRQIARLSEFAASKQLRVVEVVREVGSGLNGHRRAMLRILRNPAVSTIVVEHRDRLLWPYGISGHSLRNGSFWSCKHRGFNNLKKAAHSVGLDLTRIRYFFLDFPREYPVSQSLEAGQV